ncbi:hypothetical protein RRF57_011797 [Xylaria bambusicola]|uniref:Uncharacterized protein n=1 Tax=Xylaria bambusicola TaxID=326684 RepID=A0AAN7UNF9_9PEZI
MTCKTPEDPEPPDSMDNETDIYHERSRLPPRLKRLKMPAMSTKTVCYESRSSWNALRNGRNGLRSASSLWRSPNPNQN